MNHARFPHLVFLLVLLTASSAGYGGDEVERINGEVTRLLGRDAFDAALNLAERAVQESEAALAEQEPAFVQALRNLAAACRGVGERERARSLYERVLQIQERSLGPDHPDLADDLESLAAVYRSGREFDRAQAAYERVLALRERALGPDDPALVEALTDLAGLYQMRREFARAKPLLERAIAIREQQLGPDHPALVSPLKFLAAVNHSMGNVKAADALSDRATRIESTRPRNVPLADPEKGAVGITVWVNPSVSSAVGGGKGRMYAAKVYFVRRNDSAATLDPARDAWSHYSWRERETLAASAPEVIESNFGRKGDVYLVNADPGRYVAIGALLISEIPGQSVAYHGYFSAEVAASTEVRVLPGQIAFMGDVRATARGVPDSVQRLFHDRIPEETRVVIDVAGLGPVSHRPIPQWVKFEHFQRGGKRQSAFWKRSRKAFENDTTWLNLVPHRTEETPPDPAIDEQLSQACQRTLDRLSKGDYVAARSAATRVLEICESLNDANAPCLGPALVNLADIMTEMRDHAAARENYESAVEFRKRTMGAEHPAVAFALQSLARLSRQEGDGAAAERSQSEALELLEASVGPDHPWVADALELLARIYRESRRHEQAATLTERVVRIREDALGWTHPTIAGPLIELARESDRLGDHDRTVTLMERALSINRLHLGQSHPSTIEALFALGRAYSRKGDHQAAVVAFDKVLPLQRDEFGSKDRRIIETVNLLAASHRALGDGGSAERLAERADALCQQVALDDLNAIGEALVRYAYSNNGYPATSDILDLRDFLEPVYLRDMPVEDAWGNPYVVESEPQTYTLKSLGKDGVGAPLVGGETTSFEADIVLTDGALVQWPALR